jgi:hypothetical protein
MEHYKNSFRPILIIENDYLSIKGMGVYLKNVGNGPAQINQFRVLIDGKDIEESFDNIAMLYGEKMQVSEPVICASCFSSGQWFGKNETCQLFTMDLQFYTSEAIWKLSHRLSFFIQYESLWGDQFEIAWNWKKL